MGLKRPSGEFRTRGWGGTNQKFGVSHRAENFYPLEEGALKPKKRAPGGRKKNFPGGSQIKYFLLAGKKIFPRNFSGIQKTFVLYEVKNIYRETHGVALYCTGPIINSGKLGGNIFPGKFTPGIVRQGRGAPNIRGGKGPTSPSGDKRGVLPQFVEALLKHAKEGALKITGEDNHGCSHKR